MPRASPVPLPDPRSATDARVRYPYSYFKGGSLGADIGHVSFVTEVGHIARDCSEPDPAATADTALAA